MLERNGGPTSGKLENAFGKARGHIVRIALILEYLEWAIDIFNSDSPPPQEITAKSVKAAIRFREEYLVPMQRRTYSLPRMDETTKNAKALVNHILDERPKKLNVTKIRRSRVMNGITDSAKVKDAIALLIDAGWAFPPEKRDGPGRRKQDYTVNPDIYDFYSQKSKDADLIG